MIYSDGNTTVIFFKLFTSLWQWLHFTQCYHRFTVFFFTNKHTICWIISRLDAVSFNYCLPGWVKTCPLLCPVSLFFLFSSPLSHLIMILFCLNNDFLFLFLFFFCCRVRVSLCPALSSLHFHPRYLISPVCSLLSVYCAIQWGKKIYFKYVVLASLFLPFLIKERNVQKFVKLSDVSAHTKRKPPSSRGFEASVLKIIGPGDFTVTQCENIKKEAQSVWITLAHNGLLVT